MNGGARPRIGIRCVDDALTAMLVEWLRAAGFEPCGAEADGAGRDALLVRFPAEFDAAGRVPVVLLVEKSAAVPLAVQQRIAEIVELPDTRDIKSILEWSKLLTSVLRGVTDAPAHTVPAATAPPPQLDTRELRRVAPSLIAIGISTGGPVALQQLFAALRGQQLPPIAVVQHIPPTFLGVLTERLQNVSGLPTKIAADGEVLRPGTAYFAPGDRHLRLRHEHAQTIARLCDEPPRRGHRPAAEVLFESCADLGVRGVGVIMTGMGQDGAQGLLRLRQLGWATVGQTEATCAIYGMPRAAKAAGAVERELPLADIGPFLTMLCKPRAPVEGARS